MSGVPGTRVPKWTTFGVLAGIYIPPRSSAQRDHGFRQLQRKAGVA